ncbi:hypothetical protein [Brevibacillus sedimenti]|uniref:hypothetical protein n=1 Tax=Brevibacillus sedimenti TaxID=2613334 RepID=UPI001E2DA550|nr:hypothetical protein [Anoxybacillus sediminis]
MNWMIATVTGLVLAAACTAAVSLYVAWKLTHPPRKPVDMEPSRFGIGHVESVTFPSREDGITLSGWYIAAEANGHDRNGCTLVFAHGYGQNRLEPHLPALALAARLLAAGYDVLMFDFRNAGESTPALTTIGLREQQDLRGRSITWNKGVPGKRSV